MPHPHRTLVAAALGFLLLVVYVPGSVGAAGQPGGDRARASGFSRAEARQVLHHAQRLMQPDAGSKTTRPRARDLTLTLRDLRLARPALAAADRRQADRLLSRSTPAAQAKAAAAGPVTLCSDHFCVHYASPTTSAWATTTINTLEHVWSVEVPMMGRAPLPDGGTAGDADNPDDRLDVYLEDLGDQGLYGYCTTDENSTGTQVPAYCALDDDFARSQYGAPPINSLRVTAAHEFFHAIQFAADVSEPAWFMEGSATYMEDVVYDSINDNYQYLSSSAIRHPRTSLAYSGGSFPYGAFIFFAYSSERLGLDVIRRFWDAAVGPRPALQAVRSVVGTGAWPAFFTTYGSWNTLPLHSYSERASYPAPAWWERRTLTAQAPSTGEHSVRIAHLGSSAVLALAGPHLAVSKKLVVNIDGPQRAAGTTALLQRRYRDGRVTHRMVTLGANGNLHTVVAFNRRVLRGIAIVVANTGSSGPARLFRVRASVR